MRKVWLVEFVNVDGVQELKTLYGVCEVIDFVCGKMEFYKRIVDIFAVDLEKKEVRQQIVKYDMKVGFSVEDAKYIENGNVKPIDINSMYPSITVNENESKISRINMLLNDMNRLSILVSLLAKYKNVNADIGELKHIEKILHEYGIDYKVDFMKNGIIRLMV